MDKRRQWIVLALIILAIPTFLFGWNAVRWNVILLPKYAETGLKTDAKVVAIVEDSGERMRSKTIRVEHSPAGSQQVYRNWLRSGYINTLTFDDEQNASSLGEVAIEHRALFPFEIGDTIDVIYLPGDPNGRAVIAQDFERRYQAPMERWDYAAILLAICVSLWFMLRMSFKTTRLSNERS